MKKAARPAVVDGADLSLGAFLLMPVFAAGLSVTMWLELPTFGEALEARRGLIGERREVFTRLAAGVPTEPVRRSGCVGPLSPVPHYDEENDAATNVAILSPDNLTEIGLPRRLSGDQELYLRGRVPLLLLWLGTPPLTSQRMSRARIEAEIEQPIRNNRYVMFYGAATVVPPPGGPAATLRVDAFLYDVTTGARVCELGFVTNGGYEETRERFFAVLGETAAAAPATGRPRAY